MIPTRKLSNGVEMPYLGFGTWKLKGEECSQMVKYALDTGYTAIDTAQVYLNEENPPFRQEERRVLCNFKGEKPFSGL